LIQQKQNGQQTEKGHRYYYKMFVPLDTPNVNEASSLLHPDSKSTKINRFQLKLWMGLVVTAIAIVVGVFGFHSSYPHWSNISPVESKSTIPVNNTMTTTPESEIQEEQKFPSDFVWGVATSAYQIEGAVQDDHRGPTIWDTFVHIPGHVLDGSTGDVADDHYHRFKDDIQLMQSLNIRAYRFSIAWSRILPTGRGPINMAGIHFYNQLIDELLRQNIEPWITLFHWDLPQALQDECNGWMDIRTVHYFVEYANIIFQHFSHKVKRFITINEPWT
jgi:Glycosyl hydrolase family 1